MPARKYTDLVNVYTVSQLEDSYGGFIEERIHEGAIWVNAETATQTKVLQSGEVVISTTTNFVTRYQEQIVFSDQSEIEFKGRTYRVVSAVDTDNRRNELSIIAIS